MAHRRSSRPREPSVDEQAAFYDRWNADYRAGGFDDVIEEIRVRGQRVLDHLRALGLDGPTIIEAGCGTGWLSERLCELGPVTGVDLSPRAIDIARARGCPARFVVGDLLELPLEPGGFDVAVCVETLFAVSDQRRFMERLALLLRPNGVLGLTTVNKYVYERSGDVGPPDAGQVRRWRSKAELLELLSRHFDVLAVETVAPRGNRGLLRLVNSYKLNAVLDRLVGSDAVRRVKERVGLGGGLVIMGRRKRNEQ